MDKAIRNSLIVGGVLIAIGILISRVSKGQKLKSLDPKVEDPKLNKNFNFHLIPDGKGNYRSAQMTKEDLAYVIKKYNIKNIIRMNGDGRDSKHRMSDPETPISVEHAVCNANGCNFQFINSHEGYQKGKGYVGSLNKIIPILNKGNTLIHCAHGADRTGGIVGGYLKQGGYMNNIDEIWNYTVSMNGWDRMIKNGKFFGSGYDKYADTFYPIDLLKKKYQ